MKFQMIPASVEITVTIPESAVAGMTPEEVALRAEGVISAEFDVQADDASASRRV